MRSTLVTVLLCGLALLGMPATHEPLQAQGIDEHLEAIGRELSGGEPTDEPAPSQGDTTWERADATLEEASAQCSHGRRFAA